MTHNKRSFLVYIGAGLFLVASSIGLGVHQLTILWERRGGKERHHDSDYHRQSHQGFAWATQLPTSA